MPKIEQSYLPFSGSGYLVLDHGSSPMVGYKCILDRNAFSGGGFLLGLNEEDSIKAAQLKKVFLRVSSDKYFSLVVGRYDGDNLPIAVLGLVTEPDTVH